MGETLLIFISPTLHPLGKELSILVYRGLKSGWLNEGEAIFMSGKIPMRWVGNTKQLIQQLV